MGTIIADNYLISHRLADKARKFKISRRIAVVLLRNLLLITKIFLYETVDNVNFDLVLILNPYFKHFVI